MLQNTVFINVNDNQEEKVAVAEVNFEGEPTNQVDGIEQFRAMQGPKFLTTSTPLYVESPMKEVAKRMFFETLDLVAISNEGSE